MKLLNHALLFVAIFMTTQVVHAQEKYITYAELPQKAQTFIKDFFANEQILTVKEEKELFLLTSYDVKLANGTELEFDQQGVWKEVDTKRKAVPYTIIPDLIVQYVVKSFPANKIVQISRDKRTYEIELTNGLDLVFNKKGQFIRIDD